MNELIIQPLRSGDLLVEHKPGYMAKPLRSGMLKVNDANLESHIPHILVKILWHAGGIHLYINSSSLYLKIRYTPGKTHSYSVSFHVVRRS